MFINVMNKLQSVVTINPTLILQSVGFTYNPYKFPSMFYVFKAMCAFLLAIIFTFGCFF